MLNDEQIKSLKEDGIQLNHTENNLSWIATIGYLPFPRGIGDTKESALYNLLIDVGLLKIENRINPILLWR